MVRIRNFIIRCQVYRGFGVIVHLLNTIALILRLLQLHLCLRPLTRNFNLLLSRKIKNKCGGDYEKKGGSHGKFVRRVLWQPPAAQGSAAACNARAFRKLTRRRRAFLLC